MFTQMSEAIQRDISTLDPRYSNRNEIKYIYSTFFACLSIYHLLYNNVLACDVRAALSGGQNKRFLLLAGVEIHCFVFQVELYSNELQGVYSIQKDIENWWDKSCDDNRNRYSLSIVLFLLS